MSDARRQTLEWLRRFESPNVTHIEETGSWPIVWERASDVHVWDTAGKKYLDLTAAFGVAVAGHAHPSVVQAGQTQMETLLHAMGDVHPHRLKAALARELSRRTFERWTAGTARRQWGKTTFCNSGFEAVEAALKTARLATGRPRIVAFEGAYHGLGYGALAGTHRRAFRAPFRDQLKPFSRFVRFPSNAIELRSCLRHIRQGMDRGDVGAVLVEPVQGRAGIRVPPPGFLRGLRSLCDHYDALLIVDEILTGFGRTGRWFACEHSDTVPDVICLGKAMTGGFPLSACVGNAEVMDRAWPVSRGEAIHTSTFLGHPVGCAMALAQIGALARGRLVARSGRVGRLLIERLRAALASFGARVEVRGLGLLVGIEFRTRTGAPDSRTAMAVVKELLHRGFIVLPAGERGQVVSLTPPLTISTREIERAVRALSQAAGERMGP